MRTGVSFEDVRDGFILAHQRLRFILIDVLWRSIWLGGILALTAGFTGWFWTKLAGLEWQGPDLAGSGPIILLVAAQQLWQNEFLTILLGGVLFVLLAGGLWVILEAYFRGGRQNFWVFIGSSLARITILSTSWVLLRAIASNDGSVWGRVAVGVIFLGLAFLVVIAETLVRCDAVDLWAADLFGVASAIGFSFVLEVASLILLMGATAMWVLSSSGFGEFAAAALASIAAAGIWTVFHSYLLVVRYSTIEIVRRHVGENVSGF